MNKPSPIKIFMALFLMSGLSVLYTNCSRQFAQSSSVGGSPADTHSDNTPPDNSPPVVLPPVTPPTPSVYPGYTYNLPVSRPYISLNEYDAVSKTSAAFLRLKAQVDDATLVTANLPANASYDQLVTALNSDHYGYSVTDSIVMYRLTNDQKYIQQAIKMMDLFIISENKKIASNQNPVIAGDSYLDIGFYIEQLALTYDYGYHLLSTAQINSWNMFANQSISNVWNYATATWNGRQAPWSGWSVDDPGNNYYYSFLKATQLWSLATKNMTLIQFLQDKKYSQVVPYFSVLTGGGSREGTGYGTAFRSLFENYRYWKSSTGEDLANLTSHAQETIDYWVHATVPTMTYFASIGDQARSSMPEMFDYQRGLMQAAVALNRGTDQAGRGAWWLNRIGVADGGGGYVFGRMRYNFNFRYDLLASTMTEKVPTDLAYYSPGTGALFARSSWTPTASWFATVAGPFDQSHAHHDQGSFQMYKNKWLTVTSNTLSSSGLNQASSAHNGLRFMSGSEIIPQNYSTSKMAYVESNTILNVSQDLSPAYSNRSTEVKKWTRTFKYDRNLNSLEINDVCDVATGVTATFQIHVPVLPTISGNIMTAGGLKITQLIPAVRSGNSPQIISMKSENNDYQSGYRIDLTGTGCRFKVLLEAL